MNIFSSFFFDTATFISSIALALSVVGLTMSIISFYRSFSHVHFEISSISSTEVISIDVFNSGSSSTSIYRIELSVDGKKYYPIIREPIINNLMYTREQKHFYIEPTMSVGIDLIFNSKINISSYDVATLTCFLSKHKKQRKKFNPKMLSESNGSK